MSDSLSQRSEWIFDLDNTLYAQDGPLFEEIMHRMTRYLKNLFGISEQEAIDMREHYWMAYGTTLAGLMAEHRIDPERYLAEVHDVDFSVLTPDAELASAISALPGRKLVFTNSSYDYALKVLEAIGLLDVFEQVHSVESAEFHAKPNLAAYETVFRKAGITLDEAVFFEDDPRNLIVPHDLGLATVLIGASSEPAHYVQHHTHNLAEFLREIPTS